jgi:hypothetical protein
LLPSNALEAGMDTPSLQILAGERNPDVGELDRLFRKLLEDLSIQVPTRPTDYECCKILCRADRVCDWSAVRGANAIWWDLCTIEDAP